MLMMLEGSTSTQDHDTKKERGVGGEGGEVREEGEEKASQKISKILVHITIFDCTRIDIKFSEMKAYAYSTILVSDHLSIRNVSKLFHWDKKIDFPSRFEFSLQ